MPRLLSPCPTAFPLVLKPKQPGDIADLQKGWGAPALEIDCLGSES